MLQSRFAREFARHPSIHSGFANAVIVADSLRAGTIARELAEQFLRHAFLPLSAMANAFVGGGYNERFFT
jgi:hypothetical protein